MIDHQRKELHDSIAQIASSDNLMLIAQLIKLLVKRKKTAEYVKSAPSEVVYEHIKFYNSKIKELLIIKE